MPVAVRIADSLPLPGMRKFTWPIWIAACRFSAIPHQPLSFTSGKRPAVFTQFLLHAAQQMTHRRLFAPVAGNEDGCQNRVLDLRSGDFNCCCERLDSGVEPFERIGTGELSNDLAPDFCALRF